MEGAASTTLAGRVGRSPRTSHLEAVATGGDPIELIRSSYHHKRLDDHNAAAHWYAPMVRYPAPELQPINDFLVK